jgi:hypothetical protein
MVLTGTADDQVDVRRRRVRGIGAFHGVPHGCAFGALYSAFHVLATHAAASVIDRVRASRSSLVARRHTAARDRPSALATISASRINSGEVLQTEGPTTDRLNLPRFFPSEQAQARNWEDHGKMLGVVSGFHEKKSSKKSGSPRRPSERKKEALQGKMLTGERVSTLSILSMLQCNMLTRGCVSI